MASAIRLPSVLVIIGGVLVIVSTLTYSVRYYDAMFLLGTGMILFGIISWTLIQIYNYLRILETRRLRMMKLKKEVNDSKYINLRVPRQR